jgi:hypothetical protein
MDNKPFKLPTKFANFIATSWQMPQDFLADIFMEAENIEERNFTILIECFGVYMDTVHKIDNFWDLTEKQRMRLFTKHYDSFLAESVKLAYIYE